MEAGKELEPAEEQQLPTASLHPQKQSWKTLNHSRVTTLWLPSPCASPAQTLHRCSGTSSKQVNRAEAGSQQAQRLSPWLSEKLPVIRRDGLAPLMTLSPFTVTDFGKSPPDGQKQQLRTGPHRYGPSLKVPECGTKHPLEKQLCYC